jgi:4-alpha-glucanotransferase
MCVVQLNPDRLLAGILTPVFAIRTGADLGIGDTDGVRQMIDWCQRHGLGIFQMLPINETGEDNSPYNAISSVAIEPGTLALSPEHLPDLPPAKFKALAKPRLLAPLRRGPVNYPPVKALKRQLLAAAFENFLKRHFQRNTARARQFRFFLSQNGDWLPDYALFRVLMEENGDRAAWERWPAHHQDPRFARTWVLALPKRRRLALKRQQLFFAYVQWIAFDQWRAVRDCAGRKNVLLMGDIPFGISRNSADVWANRELFDLDWSGGAPPETVFRTDPFTEKWGQNWGVPLYRWDELRLRNFDWWRTRVGNVCKIFHLYRVDHALGFFRIYAFPWPPERNAEFLPLSEYAVAQKTGGRLPGFKPFADDTPEHSEANRRQGEEILRVIQAASGDTVVIAEDLGWVPEYVPATLQKVNLPGFRIPFLFREPDGRYSDPKQYPRLSVASPATHDHAPLAARWQDCWDQILAGRNGDGPWRELRFMMDFAGLGREEPVRDFTERLHEGLLRALMQSNSWLAVFLITDVFGQTQRFNVPGSSARGNWSHRLPQTVGQFDDDPRLLAKAAAFSQLARASGRAV